MKITSPINYYSNQSINFKSNANYNIKRNEKGKITSSERLDTTSGKVISTKYYEYINSDLRSVKSVKKQNETNYIRLKENELLSDLGFNVSNSQYGIYITSPETKNYTGKIQGTANLNGTKIKVLVNLKDSELRSFALVDEKSKAFMASGEFLNGFAPSASITTANSNGVKYNFNSTTDSSRFVSPDNIFSIREINNKEQTKTSFYIQDIKSYNIETNDGIVSKDRFNNYKHSFKLKNDSGHYDVGSYNCDTSSGCILREIQPYQDMGHTSKQYEPVLKFNSLDDLLSKRITYDKKVIGEQEVDKVIGKISKLYSKAQKLEGSDYIKKLVNVVNGEAYKFNIAYNILARFLQLS